MARNSAPKTLEPKDLVISRPVLELPEHYQYPHGQKGRARSLDQIFKKPPVEFLMGVVRGEQDRERFLKIMSSRGAHVDLEDMSGAIVSAFELLRARGEVLFPATKLKLSRGFGTLTPGRQDSGQLNGLGLTKREADPLGCSFVPAEEAPFLKFSGTTLPNVNPSQAPAVLLGPVTCRIVGAEELAPSLAPSST